MAFENMQEIYDQLYDPNIETDKYSRETLCTWVRATLKAAISQGFILGRRHMREKAISAIDRIHE